MNKLCCNKFHNNYSVCTISAQIIHVTCMCIQTISPYTVPISPPCTTAYISIKANNQWEVIWSLYILDTNMPSRKVDCITNLMFSEHQICKLCKESDCNSQIANSVFPPHSKIPLWARESVQVLCVQWLFDNNLGKSWAVIQIPWSHTCIVPVCLRTLRI